MAKNKVNKVNCWAIVDKMDGEIFIDEMYGTKREADRAIALTWFPDGEVTYKAVKVEIRLVPRNKKIPKNHG